MDETVEYFPIISEGQFTNFSYESSDCQQWVPTKGESPRILCKSYPSGNIFIKPFIPFKRKETAKIIQVSLGSLNTQKNEGDDELWRILFPGQKKPIRKLGSTDKYEGFLGKYLPEEAEIDIDKEIRSINRRSL